MNDSSVSSKISFEGQLETSRLLSHVEITGPYLDFVRFSFKTSNFDSFAQYLAPECKTYDQISETYDILIGGTLCKLQYKHGWNTMQLSAHTFFSDNYASDWLTVNGVIDHILSIVDLDVLTFGRIDLAMHITPTISLEKGDIGFIHRENCSVTEFSKAGVRTGLYIGRRTKDTVLLRCYQKSFDPNRSASAIRFGTSDFTRFEWEIPGKVIREVTGGINMEDRQFTYNIDSLWNYCLANKRPVLENLKPSRSVYRTLHHPDGTWKGAKSTILSIIDRHLQDEDLPEVTQHILSKDPDLSLTSMLSIISSKWSPSDVQVMIDSLPEVLSIVTLRKLSEDSAIDDRY